MANAETPDANFLPPTEIPVDHPDHNIVLRRYDLVNPAVKYELLRENRFFWGRTLPWALTAGIGAIKEGHREVVQHVQEGLQAPYGIEVDGQHAGAASLFEREGNSAQMGYHLDRRWLRRGIMTRAARAVAEFGLGKWGLEEIKLYIPPTNKPSIATARKIGAQSLGRVTLIRDGWSYPSTAWSIQR